MDKLPGDRLLVAEIQVLRYHHYSIRTNTFIFLQRCKKRTLNAWSNLNVHFTINN